MSETEKIWLRSGRYVCPVCKKEFYITYGSEYLYKINHKYYCSYTCWRAAQAPKPLKGGKQKRQYKKKAGETKCAK